MTRYRWGMAESASAKFPTPQTACDRSSEQLHGFRRAPGRPNARPTAGADKSRVKARDLQLVVRILEAQGTPPAERSSDTTAIPASKLARLDASRRSSPAAGQASGRFLRYFVFHWQFRSIYANFILLHLASDDREALAAHLGMNAPRRAQGGGTMDKDRIRDWQQRVREQRSAAVESRLQTEEVRAAQLAVICQEPDTAPSVVHSRGEPAHGEVSDSRV